MPYPALDHRVLRQFQAVAEAGSVRGGADALNISQPPLTKTIQRLEERLGVALFERRAKGMVLTPSGEVLEEEARKILARLERAERRVRESVIENKPLDIGFVSAALNEALPACLRKLAENNLPRPKLRELTTPEQLAGLTDGSIDLGILHTPIEMEDLTVKVLDRDPFVAAIPKDWPMANLDTLTFSDVVRKPLVLFPRAQGPSLYSAIERLAFEAGGLLDVAAEAPRVHSQLAMVASGLGIGLIPQSTARTLSFEGVRYRDIADTRERLFLELAIVGRENVVSLLG
ncbi:MAG: LysR family transcriptional regulator [Pseudomonadota bacterium]